MSDDKREEVLGENGGLDRGVPNFACQFFKMAMWHDSVSRNIAVTCH